MPDEQKSKLRLEIAHVLFIDIVGYSKLRTTEQSAQIEKLRKIVRGTDQFRTAEAEGKLLRLPTGDGGALVFRNLEAPVLCAVEIANSLRDHPELRVRMGIHSGPVNEVTDLNEQANIAGAGINIAQRVMDCGDAGHILVSKHVAEDLEQYDQWQPYLHDLGECEIKHGERLNLVNFYNHEIGNSAMPNKFSKSEKAAASAAKEAGRSRYSRIAFGIGALTIVVAAALFFASRTAFRTAAGRVEPAPAAAARHPKKVSLFCRLRTSAAIPITPILPTASRTKSSPGFQRSQRSKSSRGLRPKNTKARRTICATSAGNWAWRICWRAACKKSPMPCT